MDEIWVPSQFNMETFSRSGVELSKLRKVSYGVDTSFFHPIPASRREGPFRFLYTFAFGWRKGFDLLLRAYAEEFHPEEGVELLLKVLPWRNLSVSRILAEIRSCLPQGRRIASVRLQIGQASMDDLRRMYAECDLYISTDRANGWGMPCMEAMAMGRPAATIDWSGSTEFMNSQNSLLIHPSGRLVPVDSRLVAESPHYRGHQWAEVQVEEVRRVLRLAFKDRSLLSRIASQAAAEIKEYYCLESAGRAVAAALPKSGWGCADGKPSVELLSG
ncbi:MAG: glycosyltransferase, partial [candidate division Zixibacteria bacterium]|nr:glycosyltransferase [candidate division Zixibacteria bacterium]